MVNIMSTHYSRYIAMHTNNKRYDQYLLPHVVKGTEGSAMTPGVLGRMQLQLGSRQRDEQVAHAKPTCRHQTIVTRGLCVRTCMRVYEHEVSLHSGVCVCVCGGGGGGGGSHILTYHAKRSFPTSRTLTLRWRHIP